MSRQFGASQVCMWVGTAPVQRGDTLVMCGKVYKVVCNAKHRISQMCAESGLCPSRDSSDEALQWVCGRAGSDRAQLSLTTQ